MTEQFLAGGIAGAVWNALNFWCLTRLLQAWLGPQPSRRRALGWLLAKFPLLYAAAWVYLSRPGASVIGFGVGFTVILIAAMAWFVLQAQQITPFSSHGR